MYHQLLNHSPDLKKLVDTGYEVEIRSDHLFINNVPYLNSKKEIKIGILVSTLNFSNDKLSSPETHVVHFIGEFPHNKDGTPIKNIDHVNHKQTLKGRIEVNFSFSNKPKDGFHNYYDKMTSYINIINGPAFSTDTNATAKTHKPIIISEEQSVFVYFDTNSSRSNILGLSDKLAQQKVGIVGLGGTGSYILDFVSKTPAAEIHLFDGDKFKNHNAFRAPGAASVEILEKNLCKVEYFKNIYSNMRRQIHTHPHYLDEKNVTLLENLTFVFISVDDGPTKKIIIDYLIQNSIPFVDVGMGLNLVDNKLLGTIRVTTGTATKHSHIDKRISFAEAPDDDYNKNIQIAELNALNATLAVIKWKKLCSYYLDLEEEHNTNFVIDGNHVANDEKNNP